MLFEQRFWAGIADGSITVTFRRWKRPQAVAGRRYRTPGGIVEAERVTTVDPSTVTKADARRAGYASPDALVADLRGDPSTPVTRIQFHLVDEPDPRAVLAATASLDDADVATIDARLDRFDRSSRHGAWTRGVLLAIEEHPATRAPDLAASFGRETAEFKLDVRKLKNLGLTLSLPVGYRLSPRGEAYLRATRRVNTTTSTNPRSTHP
ncbi:MAG TPA: hypothetical protein VFZ17_07185 [Acidimicrobiia bacterium]|nr:hypothetical protein [Acidimicrobiia bacterium]